ncbi:MAG: type II toxin-antitoxin system VapC family toxin [Actinobacteria bacterium]|nr:type II toxin-antitoxin system VapC family toxin [Actinomycetota bacterium]
MSTFIDTSAFLAILGADDLNHEKSKEAWKYLVGRKEALVCSNYVLIETFALVQHRLGIEAVITFQNDVFPILTIEWVDELSHLSGVAAVLATRRKRLSLVDCVSFSVMRKLGINVAFTFDRHFKEQGFRCIP